MKASELFHVRNRQPVLLEGQFSDGHSVAAGDILSAADVKQL
jgi:hypothetical protein